MNTLNCNQCKLCSSHCTYKFFSPQPSQTSQPHYNSHYSKPEPGQCDSKVTICKGWHTGWGGGASCELWIVSDRALHWTLGLMAPTNTTTHLPKYSLHIYLLNGWNTVINGLIILSFPNESWMVSMSILNNYYLCSYLIMENVQNVKTLKLPAHWTIGILTSN